MEAKDTVMNDKQMSEVYCQSKPSYIESSGAYHLNYERSFCEAQAEISFKAGIKEVVEWVRKQLILTPHKDCGDGQHFRAHITMGEWQAKLKKWGL